MNYKNSKMCIFVESVLNQLNETKIKSIKTKIPTIDEVVKLVEQKRLAMNKVYKKSPAYIRNPQYVPYPNSYSRNVSEIIINALSGILDTKRSECESIKKLIKSGDDSYSYSTQEVARYDRSAYENAWDYIQGGTNAVQKMVLIDLLKKYAGIVIPFFYKNPELNGDTYPVYPFHLLKNFIKLQCASEMLKTKKIKSEDYPNLINSIFTSNENIARQINNFITHNKNSDFEEIEKDSGELLNNSIEIATPETTADSKIGSSIVNLSKREIKRQQEELTKQQNRELELKRRVKEDERYFKEI